MERYIEIQEFQSISMENRIFFSRDRTTLLVLLGTLFLFVAYSGVSKRNFHEKNSSENAYRFQIDLNNASVTELQTLPGIGEKLAQTIVEQRESDGPFKITKDVLKVKGIGPKKLEAMTPFLLEFPETRTSETQLLETR